MLENSSEVLQQKLYTVSEVASFLRTKPDWVRRHFRRDDVIHLGGKRSGKRRYDPIRIPESVLRRFISEHSMSPAPIPNQ